MGLRTEAWGWSQNLRIATRAVVLLFPAVGALLLLPSAQATIQTPAAPRSAPAQIYTWIGNTPGWNRKLHVSGYRLGCNIGQPQGCVREASQAVAKDGIRKIFISMAMVHVQTPLDALAYSRLSVSHPFIVEVGFDDFVDRYQDLFGHPGFDPQAWLLKVVRNIKAYNPKLAFGITLYEDELDSPYLHPPYLPNAVARDIGYVHLYLHYRADAPRYSEYVKETKRLFPQAKIIAGMYPYDRISYIPCAPNGSHAACSPREEVQLYEEALRTAVKLLKEGRIEGIEFYPGFFGKTATWPGWKNSDYCAAKDVKQCIEITRMMRDKTASILSAALGG